MATQSGILTVSLAYLPPELGVSLFLIWGESRGLSRGWVRGVAQIVCPPLRYCCVQGACALPRCPSGLFKAAVGFFGLFVSFVQNLTQLLQACSYFSSHIVSLYFVAGGERCSGASTAALQQGLLNRTWLVPSKVGYLSVGHCILIFSLVPCFALAPMVHAYEELLNSIGKD